jgi:cell wall-associated NlpC family hydrolase
MQAAVLVTGLTGSLGLSGLATPAAASPLAAVLPAAAPPLAHPVPAVPAVSPTVRQGSRGAAVVELQRLLGIGPDGVFGPQTRGAVVAFQGSRGLAADGIVGRQTWGALRGGSVSAASVAAAPAARATRSGRTTELGARAVQEASRHAGKPYRYGAAGPGSFDCSGFTQYVFAQLGVSLPHSSAAQYTGATKVAKSDVRIGDLVFMRYGGRISHVGIYAGDNTMWVARRSGTTVTRQSIWTSDYLVGRVG